MQPADYHTHTELCHHAEGVPAEYARAARAAGLDEVGIADHNPSPGLRDDWRMAPPDLPRYLELVAAAIEDSAAAGGPVVRLGMECDFVPSEQAWLEELATLAPWDYLIGSVHYVGAGWAVDDPAAVHRFGQAGVEEVWNLYWPLYVKAIRSGLFDILGHADLVKKFGHRPAGDLRRFYEPAIEALADTGTAFELNTAGWRKDCREQYPAREFLEMAALAGVPVVVSSDAHKPDEVGMGFADAVALLKESGFTRLARFEGRRRRLVPIDDWD